MNISRCPACNGPIRQNAHMCHFCETLDDMHCYNADGNVNLLPPLVRERILRAYPEQDLRP